jgi:hypothetical protein
MGTLPQVPLTPEQIAAVQDGEGHVRLQDPITRRIYILAEQIEPLIDDEYIAAKLSEGLDAVERGEVSDWNVDELKARLRARHKDDESTS